MTPDVSLPSELGYWIFASLENTITKEEFDQLDYWMKTSQQARAYYLEFLCTYISLVDASVLNSVRLNGRGFPET